MTGVDLDKAGEGYWSTLWRQRSPIRQINPESMHLRNFVNRSFHAFFSGIFKQMDSGNMKLLEVGCAGSAWLPYFARQFGFHVTGMDYSELGCQQAAEVLNDAGVEGDVLVCDMFSPPEAAMGQFDVVVSFGLIEHFENTAAAVTALSGFLKPGGIMITVIPNMSGFSGWLQKYASPEVYNIHVPLDAQQLRGAHDAGGMVVGSCDYFMFNNFGVVNFNLPAATPLVRLFKQICWYVLVAFSAATWVPQYLIKFRPGQVMSPYIVCLSKKK